MPLAIRVVSHATPYGVDVSGTPMVVQVLARGQLVLEGRRRHGTRARVRRARRDVHGVRKECVGRRRGDRAGRVRRVVEEHVGVGRRCCRRRQSRSRRRCRSCRSPTLPASSTVPGSTRWYRLRSGSWRPPTTARSWFRQCRSSSGCHRSAGRSRRRWRRSPAQRRRRCRRGRPHTSALQPAAL